MYRIDTSTKAVNLFGTGKHGFKNGDAGAGDPATALDAAYFNELQETLAFVAEQAGITLAKGDFTQLYDAIALMIAAAVPTVPAQEYKGYVTGGSGTAYTLTPTTASVANAAYQRYPITFHAVAGATPTLAVSGMTALPLKYRDRAGNLQAVTAREIPASFSTEVECNGSYWVALTVANNLQLAVGAAVASAATLDLSTTTGSTVHVTGTTATSAITLSTGQWVLCIADAAWPLTYHATNNKISGGASCTLAAGDVVLFNYDGTTVRGVIFKADGSAVVASGLSAASQAEMEAASSNAVAATPGRLKNHPGVAKAWIIFDGTSGSIGTGMASFGVASVTDEGAGDYTINFSTSFSSANYVVSGSAKESYGGGNGDGFLSLKEVAQTAGSCRINTGNANTSKFDCVEVHVVFYGDQ